MLTIHTITPLQTIPTMRFQHSRNRHVCFLDFASSCCVLPTTLMQSPGSAPRCKTCLTMTQQSRNMSVQPLGHFRASAERWPHEVALGVRQGTDPAGNTGCVRSRLGSGRKHWPRDVVVGVGQGTLARRVAVGEWQGTLARWDRGWGLARNTGRVRLRLGRSFLQHACAASFLALSFVFSGSWCCSQGPSMDANRKTVSA